MHTTPMHFAPPPRRIPLSIRIVNFFNGAAQIGWAVFGFGMIFFWAFASNADFSFLTFRDVAGRATGRVLKIESTGASENEQPVQASHYQYSVAGELYDGTSYTTGSTPAEGDEVTVEYDEDDPARSRIAGMRRSQFGPWAAILTIFPLIGFVVLYFATRMGIKRNHLLSEGVLTTGTFVRREATNVTINKRRVWEVIFEFTDRNGQRHEASARSTDTTRLEDDAAEPLLYDPNDPSKAYVLDEAPARPKFEMNGEMLGNPVRAFFALILPAIVIAGHGLVAAIKMGLVRW